NINKEKFEIIAMDNLFLGDVENLENGVKFVKGDACKIEDLEKIGPVDYVVHLAGTSSAPMFMDDGFVDGYVNSVQSFVTVLDWARKNGTKKMLYASTSSLYGNNPMPLVETDSNIVPPNHYAVTKGLYEDCSRCYNKVYPEIDIIGFRFMSIYGPNEEAKGIYANIISQFAWDMARDLEPVIYGDGTQFRDFVNVKDVVQGLTLAIETEKKLGADIFNIGREESFSFNDVVDAINKAMGKNIKPKYIPNPVKEGYVKGQHADTSKIREILGFKPTVNFEDGVKEQVENLRMDKIRKTSSDDFR
ncbi:NAD-dependent epimerase/dehydratase family protein, partial [Candidatus Gracilibacteria bacterium]|nr:NAD-dependent epimerase/dehydratase family protein [Candidatus Gracilibacteria bacterium]